MSEPATTELPAAKELVQKLIDSGMKVDDIAESLDGRVSRRTIYRWVKGESEPGNRRDHEELYELYQRHTEAA